MPAVLKYVSRLSRMMAIAFSVALASQAFAVDFDLQIIRTGTDATFRGITVQTDGTVWLLSLIHI